MSELRASRDSHARGAGSTNHGTLVLEKRAAYSIPFFREKQLCVKSIDVVIDRLGGFAHGMAYSKTSLVNDDGRLQHEEIRAISRGNTTTMDLDFYRINTQARTDAQHARVRLEIPSRRIFESRLVKAVSRRLCLIIFVT